LKKLLLIEDDRELAKMYAKKFGREGWEVKVCHNGTEAFPTARAEIFDMVLLDLMLPGLSGIDILEMLRSDKKTAMVPVVIYTNYGDKYNKEKCLEYGADEFVLKIDSTPDALSKTVERVYGARSGGSAR